jgi:DNA primase
MKGRIAIPIHNECSELVAYAGRAIDDELAKEEGKYKLPAGFQKSYVVFNLNRAKEHRGSGLIVVEGYFDAMRVHQAGFPNVVALMGASLSESQEQLLVAATDRLVLMFDGDDAGAKCLREFYGKLRRKLFLKEIHLEDGEQPDGLTDERLTSLLS